MSEKEELTPKECAKYYLDELGNEGAFRQAGDEWHNSNTPEELEYWSKVMDILR